MGFTKISDEPISHNENAEAWQEFLQEIKKIDNEPYIDELFQLC